MAGLLIGTQPFRHDGCKCSQSPSHIELAQTFEADRPGRAHPNLKPSNRHARIAVIKFTPADVCSPSRFSEMLQ
jgi:hypothetical protein